MLCLPSVIIIPHFNENAIMYLCELCVRIYWSTRTCIEFLAVLYSAHKYI